MLNVAIAISNEFTIQIKEFPYKIGKFRLLKFK